MSTLAVQTAIGEPGSKATSELTYDFNSLARVNDLYFGTNSSGLYLVDQGTLDLEEDILSKMTFAYTDFGFRNPKFIRFLYIGLTGSCDQEIIIETYTDDQAVETCTYCLVHTGQQRIRVPLCMSYEGRYWSISLSSTKPIRVDSVEAQLILRSSGITGY